MSDPFAFLVARARICQRDGPAAMRRTVQEGAPGEHRAAVLHRPDPAADAIPGVRDPGDRGAGEPGARGPGEGVPAAGIAELTDDPLPELAAPAKRKRSTTSPTQRSLALMRERGYVAEVVERWNPHARIRQDLFGVVDIVCLGNGETVAVQATSDNGGSMARRARKIAESAHLGALRRAGWRIVVQGWKKRGGRWTVREVDCS